MGKITRRNVNTLHGQMLDAFKSLADLKQAKTRDTSAIAHAAQVVQIREQDYERVRSGWLRGMTFEELFSEQGD